MRKQQKKQENNKALTRKELREELNKMALKEELKKLATKEELKKLATKEELKKLATKEELKKLDDKVNKILIEQIEMKEQMKTFATKEEMNRGFREVVFAIDALTKKTENTLAELAANQNAHDRFNRNFVRIKKKLKMNSLETTDPLLS